MLLAHKIELYPTPEQADYIDRACGSRRHAYNHLLAHFRQEGMKWSKKAAVDYFMQVLRPEFPWYSEVSARVTRNAIDDLDNAFRHFFRRVKLRQKPGYPTFHKKGVNESFALREKLKFSVEGRMLRVERLKTKIRMRQELRFTGTPCQVTISKRAGRYYAAILVDAQDYESKEQARLPIIGVDLGIKDLATISDGTVVTANQKLKQSLRCLRRRQRNLSRKQRGSNRRAKAKLSVAKLHKRIADQRQAVLHETSDMLTRKADVIVLEDLNVKGMVRNRSLARAISDAGFGALRHMIEYKSALRGCVVILAGRFYPSSKTCSACGGVKTDLTLADRKFTCTDCGHTMDRDLNAAMNLEKYGLHRLAAVHKRTQEEGETGFLPALPVTA